MSDEVAVETMMPKRFVGKKKCATSSCDSVRSATVDSTSGMAQKRRLAQQIPEEILQNEMLKNAIAQLPWNYNFEIPKSIWKIQQTKATCVALQFPEGLLMYACIISDILAFFAKVKTIILGDVTYGACCVDDLTAQALGADFLIHYGHSCLVPIDVTTIKMLYVFVDITIDTKHLIECMKLTFAPSTKLAVLGTIQFASAIYAVVNELGDYYKDIVVPQAKPLSPGEVLGCTSPVLVDRDALVFIADGRFHLESTMISNPTVKAYRYDPYPKVLSVEGYDTESMHRIRKNAIERAQQAQTFGVILGTLGRQGNTDLLDRMRKLLEQKGKNYFVLLLSEIFPDKLRLFSEVDAWIQVACPRLSIDWGYAFDKPLLSTYEAEVCLGNTEWSQVYPMNYYTKKEGSYTNYYKP